MENNIYHTGDIIFASSAPNGIQIFGHKGIILLENNQAFIYHNTPIQGYAFKDTLAEFEALGRKIKRVVSSDLTKEQIKTRFEQVKLKKFNWITWNCDQFVHFMRYGKKYSTENKILATTVVGLVAFFTLKQIKKQK